MERINPKQIFNKVARRVGFARDYVRFKSLAEQDGRFSMRWKDRHPCLGEATATTKFDHHYVYHPAWASRVISRTRPRKHIDIGSILSFSTMLSAWVPVDYYDYRPARLFLSGLASKQADLTALPFADGSIESISCMHTIEHIGLGRYGDPIDPDGDLKAIAELKRVVAKGGSLIFVTPVGRPKIMYNAHRIYSYEQILSYFEGFELKEFALIPDDGQERGIVYGASKEEADKQTYGCGCFWFVKR